MEEVEISDAIYGDLGDFEISEKVKEVRKETLNNEKAYEEGSKAVLHEISRNINL